MKFGIMSLDYKRYPLETCFILANRYGFTGLEIFGTRLHLYPDDLTKEKVKEILGYKKKYGVEIPMYTPNAINMPVCICSTLLGERENGVTYYKKAVDVAAAIGADGVLVVADHPGYMADRVETWRHLVESMTEICNYAEGKGVQVTIEPLTPLESPVVTTSDDCVRLLKDVDRDCLYAMMDVVPPVITHEPFSRYFMALGSKLNYIHVCNTDGITDAHLRLDHGILNVTDLFQLIKNQNYSGFVTTELYSETMVDPELLAANTARVINDTLSQLE